MLSFFKCLLQGKSFLKINYLILIGGKLLNNTAVGFAIHWHDSAMDAHVSPDLNPLPLPSPPISLGCPNAPAFSAPLHASNFHWSSILHKVIYMFQCYSLKSSHPRLLPQCPKVCSLHLCFLLPCIEDGHYHLYKFHIYALIYYIGISLTYFTLYNRLQFHAPH